MGNTSALRPSVRMWLLVCIFVSYIGLTNTVITIDGISGNETVGGAGVYCPIEELRFGRWINVTYDKPPYTPMRGENTQRTCPNFKPNEIFHTWEWEPAAVREQGCEFSAFSSRSFCRLVRNKTVAIVGDSISLDHYLSLSHMLGVPRALPRWQDANASLTSRVCNENSLLVGRRDFHLLALGEIIDTYFPDILVLNRGAHYVPDEELLGHVVNTVFPLVGEWQRKCASHDKECLLIWRTSVPGHPQCSQYSQPSASLDEMEELVIRKSTYNWDKFSDQNRLVLKALQKTNLAYEVMDAYFVNILRPDLHDGKDCLHTCMPDDNTYSWLLHHMLQVKYNQK